MCPDLRKDESGDWSCWTLFPQLSLKNHSPVGATNRNQTRSSQPDTSLWAFRLSASSRAEQSLKGQGHFHDVLHIDKNKYIFMCILVYVYIRIYICVHIHVWIWRRICYISLPIEWSPSSHRCCLVLVFFFIAPLDFEITSSVSWLLTSPLSISELWPGSLMSLPWLEIPE